MLIDPATIEVGANQSLYLNVTFGGSFSFKVTVLFNESLEHIGWSHEDTALRENDRVTITHSIMPPTTASPIVSTFRLSSANINDAGKYFVMAVNGVGTTTKTFIVNVTGMA